MPTPTNGQVSSYEGWIGTDAYDCNGDKVGEITDVYYDDTSRRPEFFAVRTGFFGMNTSFVPIAGAIPDASDGYLRVPWTKDHIKDAPNVDPHELDVVGTSAETGLSPEHERRLFDHYSFDYQAKRYGTADVPGTRFDAGYSVHPQQPRPASMSPDAPDADTPVRLRRYVYTDR
jgi:PRC-barrel domain